MALPLTHSFTYIRLPLIRSVSILSTQNYLTPVTPRAKLRPHLRQICIHHHGKRSGRRRRHDGPVSARELVLRNARVYTMVDDGSAERQHAGTVYNTVTLSAILQHQISLP